MDKTKKVLLYICAIGAAAYALYCVQNRQVSEPQTNAERCAEIREKAFDAPVTNPEEFKNYMKKIGCDQ